MKNNDDELKKLNNKINELDDRVTKLEKDPLPKTSSLDMNVAKNLKNLKSKQLVIIWLKIKSDQTIEQIKSGLKKWGFDAKKWFANGDFSRYILKENLAYSTDGKKSKKKFSLTSKGFLQFDKIKDKFDL